MCPQGAKFASYDEAKARLSTFQNRPPTTIEETAHPGMSGKRGEIEVRATQETQMRTRLGVALYCGLVVGWINTEPLPGVVADRVMLACLVGYAVAWVCQRVAKVM